MDFAKKYAKFRSPILLTVVLLIIIPSSAGYIDCRISCRRCREKTEHPAVLEVYCAMCEECKQRRRERMLGKTKENIKPTTGKQPIRMKVGVEGSTDSGALILRPHESLQYPQEEEESQLQNLRQARQQHQSQRQLNQLQPPLPGGGCGGSPQQLRGRVYPPGCPTPPICSDTEDEQPTSPTIMPLTQPDTTTTTITTSTTTTTTTTTQAPCPPVTGCRKKKPTHPPLPPYYPPYPPYPLYPPPPCMSPCMAPSLMCPCPLWPPVTFPPPPPPTTPNTSPNPDTPPTDHTEPPEPMNADYQYVFIGVPKKLT